MQGPDKNKMSNSISQSKMSTEPKVVSTQTTISSSVVTAEVKPQQVQAHTPDHKTYVTEIRKELTEASTGTQWSPGHNGHSMVRRDANYPLAALTQRENFPQNHDDYPSATNLTKFNTHMNAASMTLSNSELNNVCPHAKGSTKSELRPAAKGECRAVKYRNVLRKSINFRSASLFCSPTAS